MFVLGLGKRNFRNLFSKFIGTHFVFGTEENIWTCGGKVTGLEKITL
jgi:hypothetical protein